MLLTTGVAAFKEEMFKIDPYTFSAGWDWDSYSPVYWRTGDFHRSLVEICLRYGTGRIFSVTLLIATDIVRWSPECVPVAAMDIPKQRGVPICHIDPWPSEWSDRFLDEPGMLRVRLGDDRISIEFDDRVRVASAILADRASFGIDQDGFLCLIEAVGLSSDEMSLIKLKFRDYL